MRAGGRGITTGAMKTLLLSAIASAILAAAYNNAPPSSYPKDLARAAKAAADCETASKRLKVDDDSRDALRVVAFASSYYESNWYENPYGDNDKSKACGVMQTHTPERFVAGATCEKVRVDRVLGYQVGMEILLNRWRACGTLEAAMTAYGSKGGVCPQGGWVLPTVKKRLKFAGVDGSLRLP